MDVSLLIEWYEANKRDLPWRHTTDPYKIWISEIILQQTRVAQGLDYYRRFIDRFPDVHALASATEQEVLKLWQGLGYYSRARNLHRAARQVLAVYGGRMPDTYEKLLRLKGVGEYTAAAIASFCYNEPVPVVDGNVFRVLSRYFADGTPINTTAGKKRFGQLALELLDKRRPGLFNQAIMEFGALVCTPSRPLCDTCVFKHSCKAYRSGEVGAFPVKQNRIKSKVRFLNYFFVYNAEGKFILQRRTGNDIWKNLYEFPLVETTGECKSFCETQFLSLFDKDVVKVRKVEKDVSLVHKLTHQRLEVVFWKVKADMKSCKGLVSKSELYLFPLPRIIADYLDGL